MQGDKNYKFFQLRRRRNKQVGLSNEVGEWITDKKAPKAREVFERFVWGIIICLIFYQPVEVWVTRFWKKGESLYFVTLRPDAFSACFFLSADVCAASGQQVNFEKSVRFSSPNTKCDLARAISRECGSPLTSNLGADSRKTF